ncbi:MAG: class I SAM-dependent DNA methyltransferase [Gloeomargaritaceae cyanobacterium C42_A2020_066]|nr:class I SAM-dependent DNA methyltransferase [Gloeomargaritaceae cyanobacterium C42_A2020_066]
MNPESLAAFVAFCQQHIQGQEKSDAQIFLDRFFQAFGHDGTLQAGARYEQWVKGGSRQGQTGFADLVWPERVLIEMKSRGEDLAKHWPQAKDYWLQMAPPPRYVILCNFDSFWIYDFHRQPNTPMDEIELTDLPARAGAFAFMLPDPGRPIFHNNQVEITEELAKKVGSLYARLKGRKLTKIDPKVAQRFVLQCVLAMFAEDRGLLPQDLFIACVEECLQGQSTYDVLGGLFREMNQPGKTPAGRYAGVDYFNGGLFATVEPVELVGDELLLLRDCARANWKQVRPAIFGSIFEASSEAEERRPTGMHYTSEEDILKIVRPTITRHWQALIDQANTVRELNSLQLALQSYRVLDSACGSGNFLYVAYQELKWIEKVLLDKLAKLEGRPEVQQRIGFVTPNQFFRIDINPFAVELARVTLMIARKVAVDELELQEPVLPLDRLDTNVVCADALFTEWPRADAVIGNPPFLGGKHLKLQLGDEYIERVFARFPDVKDSVDFCAYWFRLAHNHIGGGGRAGLVGTNSISQGKSRAAALEYVTRNGGLIHDAVSSQPWSGEAAVHVSIVNWLKVPSPLAPLPIGEGNQSSQLSSLPGKRVGDEGLVQHLRATALELHTYRTQQMEAKQWGITKLYNAFFHEPTSQLHKLHAKLDALVLQAYGFSPTDDLLDQLLSLNLALAERERQNLPVLGPAAPHS